MDAKVFDMGPIDVAWCPGCGDYGILTVLKRTLAELNISPENLVMVSGIGQAAKIPHYFRTHFFNGLHGRALPPATAIKAANPSMTVIAESGDGPGIDITGMRRDQRYYIALDGSGLGIVQIFPYLSGK